MFSRCYIIYHHSSLSHSKIALMLSKAAGQTAGILHFLTVLVTLKILANTGTSGRLRGKEQASHRQNGK